MSASACAHIDYFRSSEVNDLANLEWSQGLECLAFMKIELATSFRANPSVVFSYPLGQTPRVYNIDQEILKLGLLFVF